METSPSGEFSFLPAQATELGVPTAPPVRRLTRPIAGGLALSALEYGDAASGTYPAPTVVFLHGAGLNAHTWDATALSLGQPALAIDLPGHGDSSWREDADYAARTNAAAIAEALPLWAPHPVTLIGQSLGGLTAAALTAAHPELVSRLVIVDITPGVTGGEGAAGMRAFFAGATVWASREELVDHALAFGLGGSRGSAQRGVYLNSRVRDDGRVEWKHHFARLAHDLRDTAGTAGTDALGDGGWDDLAAVRAPITLIRGTRGFISDAALGEFQAHVPTADVVEVATGHNVQEEAATGLARIIAGLLPATPFMTPNAETKPPGL